MEESWGTRNEGILWDLHCFFHSEIPTHSLAWSQKWPFGFPSILDIMTRARSEFLTKYLHCNDITNNPPWKNTRPRQIMPYKTYTRRHTAEMHQQLQPTSGAECRWRNDSLQGTAIIQTVLGSKADKIGDKNLGACITPKRVLSWISYLHRESWWWSYRRRIWGYSCPEFEKENYQKRSPCPHGLLLPSIFHGPVRRRSLLLWDCPWK